MSGKEEDRELEFMYRKLRYKKGKNPKQPLIVGITVSLVVFLISAVYAAIHFDAWAGLLACASQIVALILLSKILPPTRAINFEGWNET